MPGSFASPQGNHLGVSYCQKEIDGKWKNESCRDSKGAEVAHRFGQVEKYTHTHNLAENKANAV